MVEVARHQVGASEQVRRLSPRLEDEEAAVLEEPAEQASDPDVLLAVALARPERAGRGREDLDLDARVQLRDDLLVGEWFTLIRIRASLPDFAAAAHSRMWATSAGRIVNGATSSFRNACGRPKPVR